MAVKIDNFILHTQQWLNETYGNDSRFQIVEENGKVGWPTIRALTRALQIELGLQEGVVNGTFGPTTTYEFNSFYPDGIKQQDDNDSSESNVYAIIQGALFCKGYSTGYAYVTRHFYDGTGNAVKKLKKDAGIDSSNSTVTLYIMKALLSMDYFYSYDTSDRTKNIIEMQRYLNNHYLDYIGELTPCDGVYTRRTNEALIYGIQCEEG